MLTLTLFLSINPTVPHEMNENLPLFFIYFLGRCLYEPVWALKHSILSISNDLLPPVHPRWWQKQPGCQLPGNIHNQWPTSANYQQKSRIDRWAHAYWSGQHCHVLNNQTLMNHFPFGRGKKKALVFFLTSYLYCTQHMTGAHTNRSKLSQDFSCSSMHHQPLCLTLLLCVCRICLSRHRSHPGHPSLCAVWQLFFIVASWPRQ